MLVYTDNTEVDPWLVAQHIIQSTSRLCPLVAIQPIYMHPYAVAKMVSSLAHLYGRRVYLNMVAGGFKNDLVALNDATPHDRRYERLVEYTTIIQRLLSDLNPALRLPPPMDPVRDTDRAGAVCHRVTPELYLGNQRGHFGNPQGIAPGYPPEYKDPGVRMEGTVYLDGNWVVGEESSEAAAENASIAIRYTAKEVNLVMAPPREGPVQVELTLEGDQQQAGADSRLENGHAIIQIDRPRMYNLVANDNVRSGGLKLTARNKGLTAYAFTFTSCALN